MDPKPRTALHARRNEATAASLPTPTPLLSLSLSPGGELVEADPVGGLRGRLREDGRARPDRPVVDRPRQLLGGQARRREAEGHEGGEEGACVAPQPPSGEPLVAVLVVEPERERELGRLQKNKAISYAITKPQALDIQVECEVEAG